MLANPYAEHEEKSVLGTIMWNGLSAMHQCLQLRPEHFYLPTHQDVFRTCQQILAKQSDIDATLVATQLGHSIGSEQWAYIESLTDGIYKGFDPSGRVATVLEKWKLRKGLNLCSSYAAAFATGEQNSAETLASLQTEIFAVMEQSTEGDDPQVSAYSDAAWDRFNEKARGGVGPGLSYGLGPLDSFTNGMQPGQVTVVGARSGVGKSSLMKQAAAANLMKGVPVSMFSLEMSRDEILAGLWAIQSGVEYRKVIRPYLCNHAEHTALELAKDRVKNWPLRIYEDADLNLNQIVAYAQMDVRRHGTQLVCVDYAQNVEAEGRDERTKVASVSRSLTKMAKTEKCSLLLLSQLRKVPHEAYKHPPTVADLRETGQLENDAHTVVLLHRGWDDESCRVSNEATLIVGKNRHGSPGALRARFNPSTVCFEAGA
jgi:replicative DNA helicase